MARVTSKLQVTIPKAVADRYGIQPGSDVEWLPAGEAIRVVPKADRPAGTDRARRLELFDRATDRQREREHRASPETAAAEDRGWEREDLYGRGRAG